MWHIDKVSRNVLGIYRRDWTTRKFVRLSERGRVSPWASMLSANFSSQTDAKALICVTHVHVCANVELPRGRLREISAANLTTATKEKVVKATSGPGFPPAVVGSAAEPVEPSPRPWIAAHTHAPWALLLRLWRGVASRQRLVSVEQAAVSTLPYFGGDICGFDWVSNPSGLILFVPRSLRTHARTHALSAVYVGAVGSLTFL